ncbi:MAG: type I restriction endonuclease [Anaerolineales bacterium]|nr:type I restriction endonuclease [Anaerolineales bacterium]
MVGHNEAQTRKELIDAQLAKAGWYAGRPGLVEELRLTDSGLAVRELAGDYQAGDEFADYALMGVDGKPLAIVEAKRSSRDALSGQRQASDYAERVQLIYGVEPLIFLANGREIWFWDKGRYPLRQVSGFFERDDLERIIFQRRYRLPLDQVGHSPEIIDRPYQLEAVRSITEKMAKGHRKFLMVMATGDPLVPYEVRVDWALNQMLAARSWTNPQREWLKRLAAQTKANIIVDREALDDPDLIFRREGGGFARLDKLFEGQLQATLDTFHDYLLHSSVERRRIPYDQHQTLSNRRSDECSDAVLASDEGDRHIAPGCGRTDVRAVRIA